MEVGTLKRLLHTTRVGGIMFAGGNTVWTLAIVGILLGQYQLWTHVGMAKDALNRLEELEMRLEKGWARAKDALRTLQEVRDAVPKQQRQGAGVVISRTEDGICVARAMHDAGLPPVSCGAITRRLAESSACTSLSDLVVVVGAGLVQCELSAARAGCSVISFDPNPLTRQMRHLSVALSEDGWRVILKPSLAYNVTSDADYVLRSLHDAQLFDVVHRTAPIVAGEQRWSVPTSRLDEVIRQNVALLHVAIRDWRPVLQGLLLFPFKLHQVWLSSWHRDDYGGGGGAEFLEHFCEVHQLILPSFVSSAPGLLLRTRTSSL